MSDQTIDGVPRELIEKAMLACFEAGFGIPHGELRALLEAPAETEVVHEVQWNSIHGPEGWKVVDAPTYHRCTGHLWDRRITRKPAAHPQGEPVAWSFKEYVWATGLGSYVWRDQLEPDRPNEKEREVREVVPLYAEQPAPLAVAAMRSDA
jgi:hypothetical protein